MSLRQIISLWNEFFFAERSVLPIAVFRIMLGLLTLESFLLQLPNLHAFYGDTGIYSMKTCMQYLGAPCINLLIYFPPTDTVVHVAFAVLILAALCFTLGLFTRPATVLCYLLVTTLHHRDPLILNSGDTVMRIAYFFLMFAPAGELLSLDRLIKRRRAPQEVEADPRRSMWAWRMLQLQVVAIYMQCFWSKVFGTTWLDGTAVYYVLHQSEYLRFPLPLDINNVWVSRFLTYYTLVTEFALAHLLWIKELRYYILAGGLILHLGLEYSMNLPVFEQIMMATYVLFVEPADLQRAVNWVTARIAPFARTAPAAPPHS